jgi:methionyl aminopeptidase
MGVLARIYTRFLGISQVMSDNNTDKVIIKTPEQIAGMRIAGKLAADVLVMLTEHVRAGVTTDTLDRLAYDYIVNTQQAIPACLNYLGFPRSICTSINHQVCHGIPGSKKLADGDIVNIDVTVIKDGYFGDTSMMFEIGKPTVRGNRICRIAQECLWIGIDLVKPGATLGDIGYAIQKHAESNHCSVVREYCGHGVGLAFHEEPHVMHYGRQGEGLVLTQGMTFTIEPMINLGKKDIKILPDGWTVVTRDRALSAQWEHTLAVTDTGVEILTLRPNEVRP